MKRYERFVLEVEDGVTLKNGINIDVSEGTRGELIIRATNKFNNRSENYKNPPVPKGYRDVCGEWYNGFVIERMSDGSQFVWIPVESLKPNGTHDGELFTEKFGRRNFRNDVFSEDENGYYEPLTGELAMQLESIKKYGGFYIARYNISRNEEIGNSQSVKGVKPWVNIDLDEAKIVAATMENTEDVRSHLVFGAEYDSVLEWFIESKARTRCEIVYDSTAWGNYDNTHDSPEDIVATGSNEDWCINNIYDFAGNVLEWTQERRKNIIDSESMVFRGGYFDNDGDRHPVSCRESTCSGEGSYDIGFRAALYIK